MSAGITALSLIREDKCWRKLEQVAARLEAGVASAAKQAGIPIQQTRVSTTFFSKTKPVDWSTVKAADKIQFGKFFQKMLANGDYLAPSQFEAGFISIMHTDAIIGKTLEAVMETFQTW
jgi:glutamate-1-semialdehyde 2,1-aminomutase